MKRAWLQEGRLREVRIGDLGVEIFRKFDVFTWVMIMQINACP